VVVADLIGDSPEITQVRNQVIRLVGRFETGRLPPVLIQGETGTGKGLLAHALHRASPRRSGPFVDVNCAAIPVSLLEAEMFGVERGAFTGAGKARPGLFQAAHRGTLFLDEIGLVPAELQGKLLKAIEERTVRRVGRTSSEPVDVWILAATNEDLHEAVEIGRFRRDLYHRLAVVTLRLPPLRERGADVLVLAEHFLARVCADYGVPSKTLAADARRALSAYQWPGNIRQLANVIERASLLFDGAELTAEALDLRGPAGAHPADPGSRDEAGALRPMLESAERKSLLEALEETRWNLSRAAAHLRLPRNTLRYRMERHGLRLPPPSRRRAVPAGALAESAETGRPVPPHAMTPSGDEQRRITWLCARLVGAPSGASEFGTGGPLQSIAEKLHGFGGHIEGLSPTDVVSVFGLEPVEDAPRRAALAALAIQRSAEHSRGGHPRGWSVAIGIHVHDCVLARDKQQVAVRTESKQPAMAVLERLVAATPPHAVLITEAAGRFLQRGFDLEPAPPSAELAAYSLTGCERAGFGRPGRISEFVGRDGELALLASRLTSVTNGQGQVVAIVGEAGIGKSRLLAEFRQRLGADQATCLQGRCASYASSIPYLPVLEIVRQHCGITEADRAESVGAKMRSALDALGLDPSKHAPYLVQLVGADQGPELRDVNPELMKSRIFEAVRQFLLRASRPRPLVLALEDLHWIDQTSDELVARLADSLQGAPILLVTTYRPGYHPAWLARSYATQIALAPLSSRESHAILRSALHSAPVSQGTLDLMGLMVARADGNPFFLEELARALAEPGPKGPALTVPDTIEAVVAARIDRLSPDARRLLQVAAVIGKDVPVVLLEAITAETGSLLRNRLRQLQTSDFLYEAHPAPGPEFTFKHALTQEVAYGSVTPENRRTLHRQTAQALIRACPEMAESRPEVVASHLTEAGLPGEAIPHWLKAGRAAIRRSANVEAVSHLRSALALLAGEPARPERDRQELELQLALGPVLVMTQGYAAAEVEAVFRRAQTLCESLGETPQLFPAMWGIAVFHLVRGDLRSARAVAERLLSVATQSRNEELLLEAHLALGAALFYQGTLQEARAHFEECVSRYDPERHAGHAFAFGQDPGVASLGFLGWTHVQQGRESEALACIERALGHAERVDHAFSRAFVSLVAANVHELRGDFRSMLTHAERAVALATQHRFPFLLGGGICLRARVLAAEGRHAESLTLMAEGLGEWQRTGAGLSVAHYLGLIADTYRAIGDAERGLAAVADGLAAAERGAEYAAEPELHRIRGELLASDPGTAEDAETAFALAISLARRHGSIVFARRAAASLAAHLRKQGRHVQDEQVAESAWPA
jgi:DNA-binding NtrC family response regulator/predicted ATPase